MSRSFAVRGIRLATVLVAGVLVAPSVHAQETNAQQTSPEKYLELLRSDLRTTKLAIVTDAMNLTQAQADAFWPIYREYETEASAIGDRRVAMVKQFAEKYGKMTDVDAAKFMTDWFAVQNDRLKLREKYAGRVTKAVSSLVAARFMQVDYTLGMLIDLQIAAELPLMK